MAMRTNDNNILDAVTVISEQGFDGMAEALRILFNEEMLIEHENI